MVTDWNIESSSLDTAARLFRILTGFHASLHQRRAILNGEITSSQDHPIF